MTRFDPPTPPFADGPVNRTCALCGASTTGALCSGCVSLPGLVAVVVARLVRAFAPGLVVPVVLAAAMASQALRAAPAAAEGHNPNCLCAMCGHGPPPTQVSTVADRKAEAAHRAQVTQNRRRK